MRNSLFINLFVLVIYPLFFISIGIPMWIFFLIVMSNEYENGKPTDIYYEIKSLITPKNYFIKNFKIIKDLTIEGVEETKTSWPVLLVIAIIALLPLTLSIIFGWL